MIICLRWLDFPGGKFFLIFGFYLFPNSTGGNILIWKTSPKSVPCIFTEICSQSAVFVHILWGLLHKFFSSATYPHSTPESMASQKSTESGKVSEVDAAMVGSEHNSSSEDSDGSNNFVLLANLRANARAKWHQSNPHPDDGVLVCGPRGSIPHIVAELFSEVEGMVFDIPSKSHRHILSVL